MTAYEWRISDWSSDVCSADLSARVVIDEATFVLPLAEVIDIAKEKERLGKERDKALAENGKNDAKLGDATFVARAPEAVVEEQSERREDQTALADKHGDALRQLGGQRRRPVMQIWGRSRRHLLSYAGVLSTGGSSRERHGKDKSVAVRGGIV